MLQTIWRTKCRLTESLKGRLWPITKASASDILRATIANTTRAATPTHKQRGDDALKLHRRESGRAKLTALGVMQEQGRRLRGRGEGAVKGFTGSASANAKMMGTELEQ